MNRLEEVFPRNQYLILLGEKEGEKEVRHVYSITVKKGAIYRRVAEVSGLTIKFHDIDCFDSSIESIMSIGGFEYSIHMTP